MDGYEEPFLCCKAQFSIIPNALVFLQSQSHGGAECNEAMGWILSKKGKATTFETTYNPDDTPEVYSNPSTHSKINVYTEMGRQIHGTKWDPIRASFDGGTIMRMGQGKKCGHYYMGDNILDLTTTPTLATLKARDTGNAPPILPQPVVALAHVD
jgi:hypothetical protein